jgi:hypothetical protein
LFTAKSVDRQIVEGAKLEGVKTTFAKIWRVRFDSASCP